MSTTPVYDKEKSPEAGRKSDAKTGGGYEDIKLVNGKPEFMSKSGKAANKGGTYYLLAEDKTAFDDSKFVPGDEVASIMVAKFTGDRGNIDTVIGWKNGTWTAAMSRKARDAKQVRCPVQQSRCRVSIRLCGVRQRTGAPRFSHGAN
jgi:hypothetical protein